MAVVKWVFIDPEASTAHTFEINPNEGGSPAYEKNIVTQNTTAPGGTPVVMEGQEPPKKGSFSGTILALTQYQAMTSTFSKHYPIYMDDDLGRRQTIYITSFAAKRVRSAVHPYKHTYTVSYIVLATDDMGVSLVDPTWNDLPDDETWDEL